MRAGLFREGLAAPYFTIEAAAAMTDPEAGKLVSRRRNSPVRRGLAERLLAWAREQDVSFVGPGEGTVDLAVRAVMVSGPLVSGGPDTVRALIQSRLLDP
ncbi:hypothetical protein [Arthrobacter sp. Ld5]|uniref:hypothetical protein n=1 Tax=Arthrobacter sp. Ld5 TaxID=649152 RepID=UPI003EC05110